MSIEDFQRKLSILRDALLLGGIIASFVSLIFTVLFYGIMTIYGPYIKREAQEWLGITDIGEALVELTGQDRITQQPAGLSYVREPVHVGDNIQLVIYIGRTARGQDCQLLELIPIYTDDGGIVYAGERRNPSEQLGSAVVRRELSLNYPDGLRTGRTSLVLQLQYNCNGETIFETTEPVHFQVELRNDPTQP
jgi:hypothetical protein